MMALKKFSGKQRQPPEPFFVMRTDCAAAIGGGIQKTALYRPSRCILTHCRPSIGSCIGDRHAGGVSDSTGVPLWQRLPCVKLRPFQQAAMGQYEKNVICSKTRNVVDSTDFSLKSQVLHG